MELNLCHFLNDKFHTSGFIGHDIGVIKLDAYTSLYCAQPWPIILDVLMMIFDPGLKGEPSLSNVVPSTLTRSAVYARCSQAKAILYLS